MPQGLTAPPRWRLIDQSLSVQFLVAGGVVALFSIVSLILLLAQLDREANTSRWVGQTHRMIGRLNTLARDLYKQQGTYQDLMKARDEHLRAAMDDGERNWDQSVQAIQAALSEALSPDPDQPAALARLKETHLSWIELTRKLAPDSKAPMRSLDPSEMKLQSSLFKDTYMDIEKMIEAQNRLLSVRDREQKTAIQRTFTVVSAMNILLLLVFGIVLTKLYFSIARPISHLSQGMGDYRSGEFETRVPVSNASEIGFLESSFNSMAGDIETMVRDLRKLDELKSEFLSTVSHELRTPLTAIAGYVKLLVSGDAGACNDTQRDFLKIIDTNVTRLGHLINDILDVEKLESGRFQILHQPVDLASVLKECRDSMGIVASQKGLELRYRVPAGMKPVLGDRRRLVQAFMNLLSNAIKYTPKGTVEIEAEDHDYGVTVRIRDSGIGLSPEEQENLFQKFYRAKSGLSSGEGGTGLGLVIARGLIEAHGGKISVESEVGQGTTFQVSLARG